MYILKYKNFLKVTKVLLQRRSNFCDEFSAMTLNVMQKMAEMAGNSLVPTHMSNLPFITAGGAVRHTSPGSKATNYGPRAKYAWIFLLIVD